MKDLTRDMAMVCQKGVRDARRYGWDWANVFIAENGEVRAYGVNLFLLVANFSIFIAVKL